MLDSFDANLSSTLVITGIEVKREDVIASGENKQPGQVNQHKGRNQQKRRYLTRKVYKRSLKERNLKRRSCWKRGDEMNTTKSEANLGMEGFQRL